MTQISLLLGGLALFLYGMDQMGKGLELLAGNKLQSILEKLTSNKVLGVLIGALVTAIIQSSSATTVMAVGFVNSKILSLTQAINIIMGANIGTTITGLLLTLDINLIAPIITFIGMIMQLFTKKRKYKYTGIILFGFGVLFMGMQIMGSAVKPLAGNPEFTKLLAGANNPLVGIIIGALFTAIIQSSSATTGILITLANTGLLTFASAFYLVLGQNIGTCITSVLASMGTNKNAKRVAVTHVSFNVIGTVIFSIISFITPLIPWIQSWSNEISGQIALMHTFFNVVTTILLFPFTKYLVNFSRVIIKGEDPDEKGLNLMYLNPHLTREALPTIAGIRQESIRMLEVAKENLKLATTNIIVHDEDAAANIEYNEELIDFLNTQITKASVKTMTDNLNKSQYKQLSYFLKIASNIERLGDYAYNISSLSNNMGEKNIKFTDSANDEINKTMLEVYRLFDQVIMNLKDNDFDMKELRTSAFKISDMIEKHRENYVDRLKDGAVEAESGLYYDKFYAYVIRIKDHLINVANQYSTIYK